MLAAGGNVHYAVGIMVWGAIAYGSRFQIVLGVVVVYYIRSMKRAFLDNTLWKKCRIR